MPPLPVSYTHLDVYKRQPHISTVPVEPGLTNAASKKNGERLVGFNTENEEINEGKKLLIQLSVIQEHVERLLLMAVPNWQM